MKNRLLFMLLALLGFAACNDEDDYPVMYGSPHSDYVVRGTVTDPEGSPVRNIHIYWVYGHGELSQDLVDKTDETGAYTVETGYSTFELQAVDVDGEANGGLFAPQDFPEIKFTEADRTAPGDGPWYYGRFEKRIDLVLERESDE